MQTTTFLTTLLAAAATTVSGAAIAPRQANAISIARFAANCIPHSVLCVYDFTAITSPTSASPSGNPDPVRCTKYLQGPDRLPDVALTGCDGLAYAWAVSRVQGGGLQLTVTTPRDSHTNYTGTFDIGADQLVMEQHEASVVERYTGPGEFDVAVGWSNS
ncbi:uncharacterized protein GGS25DRAFT_497750 [Hypoxylon fragiforme]|uniref:uncharacterized protein n=1 Tax=Hypoxylon fragiforme TaxID=63214 RepID=UPI0020C683C9|nr:uncharacterized protein GGS25DRAFT_497750 [Hypoxylon fragiforme]KAI2605713.1 hypothetical protein GGS25DRAFT_497750 [Hypoxylon fragiforme]